MGSSTGRLLRGHTYANVVATLALVVAVGGTSYAAVSLPKNSVGSAQIKKDAVKSPDIKNNTIKGNDVRDGGLTAADLAPGTIPATTPPSGPAGGALGGSYPNPTLAASAPGTAVAGMFTLAGVGPTVANYFNRLGGAPTITRTGTGTYTVDFPGSSSNLTTNTIATGNVALGGFLGINSGSGSLQVTVYNSAGTVADSPFSLFIFASGVSGGTTLPAKPSGTGKDVR